MLKKLIKVAYDNKSLRGYLLPLIKESHVHLPKGKWVDIETPSLSDKQLKELWEMYTHSYRDIGLSVSGVQQMKSKYCCSFLIDVDRDPDPDAFILYKKTPFGKKISLLGTDGQKAAKRQVITKMLSLVNSSGYYLEASHGISAILERSGVTPIDDPELVSTVLKKDIRWLGGGKYERLLKGVGFVEKSLYGNPRV